MSLWIIRAAANGVIMVAYLAIAFSILNGIAGTGTAIPAVTASQAHVCHELNSVRAASPS